MSLSKTLYIIKSYITLGARVGVTFAVLDAYVAQSVLLRVNPVSKALALRVWARPA